MPNIGYGELLVILLIVLLLFGAKRIPEIAKSLGKSLHLFKSGLREGSAEDASHAKEDQPENEKATRESKP